MFEEYLTGDDDLHSVLVSHGRDASEQPGVLSLRVVDGQPVLQLGVAARLARPP